MIYFKIAVISIAGYLQYFPDMNIYSFLKPALHSHPDIKLFTHNIEMHEFHMLFAIHIKIFINQTFIELSTH